MTEIVEIYREPLALHVYRKTASGTWYSSQEGGANAVLYLFGAADQLSIRLSEIYEFAMPDGGFSQFGAGRNE